jgi:hypothetical protein
MCKKIFKCSKYFVLTTLFSFLLSCSDDYQGEENSIFDDIPATEVSIFTPQTELGYFLVTPIGGSNSFLLDTAGYVVHKYPSTHPTFMGYLRSNGTLVRAYKIFNPNFANNGETGGIEIIDETGEVLWSYEVSNSNEILHHDLEILPNGNILAVIWYKMSSQEILDLGRDPSLLSQNEVHLDRIVEIKPVGNNAASIVWEWNSKDHLIQDYDSNKLNYGIVNQNPGKLNLNYSIGDANHTHINGISYDAEHDLIIVSSHRFNEIWILDHSTTSSEAASSSGGRSNKGGELLYRFGNPEAFNNGDSNDKMLFGQHDPTYISNSNSFGGNLLLFNNNVTVNQSSVMEFKIPFNGSLPNGNQVLNNLPNQSSWSFQSSDIFSPIISGAQRLLNGNTFITAGRTQKIIEINKFGEIVFRMDFEHSGSIFKARKYPINYSGLPSNLTRITDAFVTN